MMSKKKIRRKTTGLIILNVVLLIILAVLVSLAIYISGEGNPGADKPGHAQGNGESGTENQAGVTTLPENGETEATIPRQPYPWEFAGAKQPGEYTWEEFLALPAEQQIGFQNAFASNAAFEAWMDQVFPTEPEETTEPVVYPWEQAGGKEPGDYTWEEYQALSGEEQIAFQKAFSSDAAFAAWMERVQPTEPDESESQYPWEKPGAKQPENYTWEEYQALSGEEQIAFQKAFSSDAAFAAWMERVQPTEPDESESQYPWEKPGAKQPEDYTWEEYLALSGEEQIAFQKAFSSDAAFAAWMERVQPTEPDESESQYPWEKPGAKQPEDYTWEEFLALSGEEQIAFQNYMGPEAFEAWMNRVQGEG